MWDAAGEPFPGHLDFGHFALVFREALYVALARAVSLSAGDIEVLGKFRDDGDCLHARAFEKRKCGRVALKTSGQSIQTLGNFLQYLRRWLQRARVGSTP